MAKKDKVAKLGKLSPKEKKYKNIGSLKMDLQLRLELALEEGVDPLGFLSIKQIAEDLKFVDSLSEDRTIDSDLYLE